MFFKAREEHYENETDHWSSDRVWVDKGKAKYPVWLWILAGTIALIPFLGMIVMLVLACWLCVGIGNTWDRERFKLNSSFFSFLNKRY
jgi:hypothetical protein